VDSSKMEDEEAGDFKQVFINAEILEENGEDWTFEEGCLSIPEIREDVDRPETILIKFFDENWIEHKQEFEGIVGRIIQHEYDHIEGILFTDHLTAFKKRLLKGKLSNISRGKVDTTYRIHAPLAKV